MSSGGIGLNDKPAPIVTRQVGGVDPDGNLQPIRLSSSGEIIFISGADVATGFTTEVVSTTGDIPLEITAIANQIGIEIQPLSPALVYWGPNSSVSSTNRPPFKIFDPLRRPTNASIWVVLATGATNIELCITRWTKSI